MEDRIKWIDSAKGISILLVIIGHVGGGLEGVWNFDWVYGVHLVMFFLLSGYTLKKKEITREFLNMKFRRLMVPYFYTCIAIIVTDIFNSWYFSRDLSNATITRIIGNDLTRSFFASGACTTFGTIDIGTRIGAIWFFPAMFFAILIFQFLLSRTEDDRALGILTAIIAYSGYISAKFIWLPFSIQSGMFASFFVWIGWEIKKQNLLSKVRWYHYVIAEICLLLGIHYGYCNIGFVCANLHDLFISIPVGLSGCLLIYLLSKTDIIRLIHNTVPSSVKALFSNNSGLLAYMGTISSTILCVHLYALETMTGYFQPFLDKIGLTGNHRVWTFIVIHVLFATIVAILIEQLKRILTPLHLRIKSNYLHRAQCDRDTAIDVAKGIFICSMILGHYAIDGKLRAIIYSCHMIAFVVFSGYFYRHNSSFFSAVKKMIKRFLIPYMIFVVMVIITNYLTNISAWNVKSFKQNILCYLFGISFSNKIFNNIVSVGPVYFILMLFMTRFLYMLLNQIIKEQKKMSFAILCISILGVILGKEGWWLPWSIDIACYSLIFYHIGVSIRENKILTKVRNWHISYFVLSPIWVYMIYSGSMEIVIRNYGDYGVVILGAVAGTLLVYKVSVYICNEWPVISLFLDWAGKESIIILFVHTILSGRIQNIIGSRFNNEYILATILVILIQVVLGIIIGRLISITSNTLKRLFYISEGK